MTKLIYFEQDQNEKHEYTLICVYFKDLYEMVTFDWAKANLKNLSSASVKTTKKVRTEFVQKGSPLKFMLDKANEVYYQSDFVFYQGLQAPIKFRLPMDGSLVLPITVDISDVEIRVYELPELYLTVEAQESSSGNFDKKANVIDRLFDWKSSFTVEEVTVDEIRSNISNKKTPIFIIPSNDHDLEGFLED